MSCYYMTRIEETTKAHRWFTRQKVELQKLPGTIWEFTAHEMARHYYEVNTGLNWEAMREVDQNHMAMAFTRMLSAMHVEILRETYGHIQNG